MNSNVPKLSVPVTAVSPPRLPHPPRATSSELNDGVPTQLQIPTVSSVTLAKTKGVNKRETLAVKSVPFDPSAVFATPLQNQHAQNQTASVSGGRGQHSAAHMSVSKRKLLEKIKLAAENS